MASTYIPTLKALILVVSPILLGAGWFLSVAPARQPGVYLEFPDRIFELTPCEAMTARTFPATAPKTSDRVAAFVVVRTDEASTLPAEAFGQLFLTVVNHAEPGSDLGRFALATDVQRIGPGIHRVMSSQKLQWEFGGLSESVYRQALAQHKADRATTELMVELDVPATSRQGACRYGVVVGPPSLMRDTSLGWFVASGGERK